MSGRAHTRSATEMRVAREISAWIRRMRVEGGHPHGRLAEVAGVVPSTLRHWEDGESMPSVSQLVLLRTFARKQGVEVPEL